MDAGYIEKELLEQALNNNLALTYEDVRVRTGYSKFMPDEVNIESLFSRNVRLKTPIISAAMDRVTEYELAIEIAKIGGLGIIHKNMNCDEQARQVGRVKHYLNGLIQRPIMFFEHDRVEAILARKKQKGYRFNSFPILDSEHRLVGVLSGNDFDFCEDTQLQAKEVMSRDVLVGEECTTLEYAYDLMKKNRVKVLPLVDSNRMVKGMYVFSDVKRILTGDAVGYNLDDKGQLRVGAAVGVYEDAYSRIEALKNEHVDVVVIDTAHGDSKGVIETVKELKKNWGSELEVVAGNISVGESAGRLVDAGVDGIKVGQGPGSICTTRMVAGVGRPQVSAVYECTKFASGVPVCADGGIRNSGDLVVAIAAGAHSVMLGNLLAGTAEAPGEIEYWEGRRWKSYRGMGSMGAMNDNKGSRDRYLQGDRKKGKFVPEGIEGRVPYLGPVREVLYQYIGGLRSGMGYVGAKDIEELRVKGEFDRITLAGKEESAPHNISITKEAPNYRI